MVTLWVAKIGSWLPNGYSPLVTSFQPICRHRATRKTWTTWSRLPATMKTRHQLRTTRRRRWRFAVTAGSNHWEVQIDPAATLEAITS